MSTIGEPQKVVISDPVYEPVPTKPEVEPEPTSIPEPQPEKEPVTP